MSKHNIYYMAEKGLVEGMTISESYKSWRQQQRDGKHTDCNSCKFGKSARVSIDKVRSHAKAEKNGQVFCADTCEIECRTPGGFKYLLCIGDDKSRFCWVYLLRTKTAQEMHEVLSGWWFTEVVPHANRTGIKCLEFFSDGGTEFVNSTVRAFFTKFGVKMTQSPPDTQALNGFIERRWLDYCNMARTCMIAVYAPKNWWGGAVSHACWTKNRTVTHSHGQRFIPYTQWHGRKPNMRMARPFGARAFVH